MLRKRSLKRYSRQRAFVPTTPPPPESVEIDGHSYTVTRSVGGLGVGDTRVFLEARRVDDPFPFPRVWSAMGETDEIACANLIDHIRVVNQALVTTCPDCCKSVDVCSCWPDGMRLDGMQGG